MKKDLLKIVIWHVGGSQDNIGPSEKLLQMFPDICSLVLFDARSEGDVEGELSNLQQMGLEQIFVNKCVGESAGMANFYVNKYVDSSSLLPPSPKTSQDDPNYSWCKTWGENCELDKTVQVELTTIDQLVLDGIPAPDYLSIDAQGAELMIMKGGANAMANSVLCCLNEVEYFEIYAGQGLLHDQLLFLEQKNFRLVDIFNPQYWHPSKACGEGFLTVGEALFFKQIHAFTQKKDDASLYALLKLAIIGFAFNRFSFCKSIFDHVTKTYDKNYLNSLIAAEKTQKLYAHYDRCQKEVLSYYQQGRRFPQDKLGNFTGWELQSELFKRYKNRLVKLLKKA